MKIEAYLLCYNEEKMIRHTLNHYSAFCSKITVYDNESTDSTRYIINNEYPHVNVIVYNSQNQLNDNSHIALKNAEWKGSEADYVIMADMDELLWDADLTSKLERCKKNNVIYPIVEGYNMFSDEFPSDYSRPITKQVIRGVRSKAFDKQMIFDPKHVKQIDYLPGAHKCNNPIPDFKKRSLTNDYVPKFKLLHYKYLGEQYLIERHKMYAGRLSQDNFKNGYGVQYLDGEAHIKECFRMIRSAKEGLINISL